MLAGTTSHIGPALSIWGLVARLLACFLVIRFGCLHRYFPILRLSTAQLAFACFKRMMLLLPLRLSSLTFGRPWPEDLMLACRMTRGIPQELLLRASAVFGKQIVADTCARAIELGLATWGAPDGENYVDASSGGVDLFPGALAPTQQGWLEARALWALFGICMMVRYNSVHLR